LKNFVNNDAATNCLQISSQHLSENPNEDNEILIGSYILFRCKSGYTNIDNNLKVTCNANGQWSSFPTCIPLSTRMASSINFMNSVKLVLVLSHLGASTTTMGSNSGNNGAPMMNGSKRKKY
jgi:hypothetical protein